MATYLLLDGHSLAFRAWFALQEAGLRTSSGQETQAVYGFTSMVTKLLGDFAPDGMAVAFDRAEPTFRDELAPDYKAGRAVTPEPLHEQIELIRQLVVHLGVPAVDAVGYEADDVLATLACGLAARGEEAIVVTGDRDAFQLVEDPGIRVLYNRRGVSDYALYDEAGILERTGVPPRQYPLLAALRGDPSDNLPGVPGVGEKTAAKLVNAYGDLEGIFANLASLTPKLRESLATHEEQVRRNAALTPVVREVPVELDPPALLLGREDREGLSRLFGLLEMRTPKERLFAVLDQLEARRGGPPGAGPAPAGPGRLALPVRTLEDAPALLEWAARAEEAPEAFVVAEPAWAGVAGRSELQGIALFPEGADEVVFLPGGLLGDPVVQGALGSLLGEAPPTSPGGSPAAASSGTG